MMRMVVQTEFKSLQGENQEVKKESDQCVYLESIQIIDTEH